MSQVCLTAAVIDRVERKRTLAFTFLFAGLCIVGGVLLEAHHFEGAMVLMCMNALFEQAIWCYLIINMYYMLNHINIQVPNNESSILDD